MEQAGVIVAGVRRRVQVRSFLKGLKSLFRRQPVGTVSAGILLGFILMGVVGPYVAPYDPVEIFVTGSARDVIVPPSWDYWGGLDNLGRDQLSRLVVGARTSLMVAALVVGVALSIGMVLGLTTGYYRGIFDLVLMRLTDLLLTIPGLLLALVVVTSLGPSLRNVVIAIAVGRIPTLTRLVRSVVLSVKETDYVMAARAMGARDTRIMLRHIMPQTFVPVVVMATAMLPSTIIAEASLAFLGLGVPPPAPSWGKMLAESRDYILQASYLMAGPAVLIGLTVFSGNMVGDMMRDVLDPRLRGKMK